MSAASNLVPGISNFRSLQGIPVMDGRRVKPDVIYRSEALIELTPEGEQALEALGIRTVCDLRSAGEQAKDPLRWPGRRPQFLEVEAMPDVRFAGEDIIRQVLSDPTGQAARQILLHNSAQMPNTFAKSIGKVFSSILAADGLPLLVTCAIGKDRTGYVVSAILLALGASEQEIVDEFMRSAAYIDIEKVHAAHVAWLTEPLEGMLTPEGLGAVSVLSDYLDAAFATIRARYGSHDAFLRDACGLDDARLTKIRALLLE